MYMRMCFCCCVIILGMCMCMFVRICMYVHAYLCITNRQTRTHICIYTQIRTHMHMYILRSHIHTVYINSCACLIYTSVLYISTYKHPPENIQFTNTNGTHSKMISGLQHCHVYTCIISMYIHASSPCSQQDYISDSPHKQVASHSKTHEESTPRYVIPAVNASRSRGTLSNRSNGSSKRRNGDGDGDGASDMELTPVSETKIVVPKGRNNLKVTRLVHLRAFYACVRMYLSTWL